jgi:hypothetical protein
MVRVERLISLAMARIDPPALLASWTAARISASASLMRRATARRWMTSLPTNTKQCMPTRRRNPSRTQIAVR